MDGRVAKALVELVGARGGAAGRHGSNIAANRLELLSRV